MARSPEQHDPHRRAALRTRAATAVAAGLLVVVAGGMVALVSRHPVGGSEAALLTLPAAAASVFALLGLAAERDGWPPRRVLATVVSAACTAAQLGAAAFVANERGSSWLAIGGAAALVNLVAVAVVDRRARARGQLLLAVVLWVGVALVLGGAGLVAAYLHTHEIWTIL